jgi:hypothetical protein
MLERRSASLLSPCGIAIRRVEPKTGKKEKRIEKEASTDKKYEGI